MKIKDKIVEVDEYNVIKATAEEIKHEDGRVDVIVKAPCLKIQSKKEK